MSRIGLLHLCLRSRAETKRVTYRMPDGRTSCIRENFVWDLRKLNPVTIRTQLDRRRGDYVLPLLKSINLAEYKTFTYIQLINIESALNRSPFTFTKYHCLDLLLCWQVDIYIRLRTHNILNIFSTLAFLHCLIWICVYSRLLCGVLRNACTYLISHSQTYKQPFNLWHKYWLMCPPTALNMPVV